MDRHPWTERMLFTSYGVRVGIRVDRSGVLDQIRAYLPPGWRPSQGRAVKRMYSVFAGGRSQGGGGYKLVYADGDQLIRTRKLLQAIEVLESDLQLFVAETAPRRVFVHAGVVAFGDKAIVIPGRSFSGKTSLVTALVKAGATYYSDEYAVIDELGRVHNYARPLSIRQNGYVEKPGRYKVETLGGRTGVQPLPVAMVIVSKFKEGARWRPRELSDGEGALELMANTVSARRRPEAMLEAIRLVVAEAPVLKGNRGEARQVVDFILAKLGLRITG